MRKERILKILQQMAPPGAPQGATASEVAQRAGVQRHNASADLNELCREGAAEKQPGHPVRFWALPVKPPSPGPGSRADRHMVNLVGATGSLRGAVEQARAAMLYPPCGLPTLVVGPTGSGKSSLAEAMYHYAVEAGRLAPGAPLVVFNCADYAANPQLLVAQLFGHVKGAFTGADRESTGMVAEANGGMLFLDEIHRLPPDGQEMLFMLIDKGVYRAVGNTGAAHTAAVTLVAATSEDPHSVLLHTFRRRFPVVITLPDLSERPLNERLALVEQFLAEEADRVGLAISVSPLAVVALLTFRATGNVGELRSAILLGCAKAFLHHMAEESSSGLMRLYLTHLAPQIQMAYLSGGEETLAAERLVGPEDRRFTPASQETSPSRSYDDYVPSDLYSELRRRVQTYAESGLGTQAVQQLIQTDLDYYVRRLVKRTGGAQRIPRGLLEGVRAFVGEAERKLGRRFGHEVVAGIAMHLVAHPRGEHQVADRASTILAHCPQEYAVVRALAPLLQEVLGEPLTAGETNFIALFLAARGRSEAGDPGIAVLVVAHGNSTASSMADVANELLRTSRALAVDMPLEQSVPATLRQMVERIQAAGPVRGIVLLADMGSLTGLGPALEEMTGAPTVTIPLVTTAAVIEATRVAGQSDIDLAQVVKAVRSVFSLEDQPLDWADKKVIITTCLTGEGTARKLAAFITEALPTQLQGEVNVHPVDLEHGAQLPGLLVHGWRGAVVAAAGTVDPRIPGVPFIGIEQILFGEGMRSLIGLAAGRTQVEEEGGLPTREQAVELATRFVMESITAVDGPKVASDTVLTLNRLEQELERRCEPGQAARWIIHFAFALERLATADAVPGCSELPYLQEHHGSLLETIRRVIAPVAQERCISVPEQEIGFLALILLSE